MKTFTMINRFLSLFLLVNSMFCTAQSIELHFPYFAGKTYDFAIFQGNKRVTLFEDTIPSNGKVKLVIPDDYKGYKGMAQWHLTNSATGGGLDLIVNKEDFSVTCLDSIPSYENIIYSNTTENGFDRENFKIQQKLYEKHDAMLATIRAYEVKSTLHKLATKEYESILKQYQDYSKALQSSNLYAAKFRQIVNLSMGIGTIITLDEKQKANDINHFVTNDLDFDALYTSNHWGGIISNWIQLHLKIMKDDTKLEEDIKSVMNRIQDKKIFTDFVIKLTKELTKVGKDNVLFDLIPQLKNSNQLLTYEGVLSIYKQDISGKAPDLEILTSVGINATKSQETKILKTELLSSKFSLLLFYKSGCGPCESTINSLKVNFSDLTSKGIRIIALSSDMDEEEFKKTAASFPWTDTYCDFKGMNGVNFKNYGVIGTPTLYLLDNKGIIIKKFAIIDELLDWSRLN